MAERPRDPVTGRLLNKTVCGRRFCRICGKWKHLLYFHPRKHKRNGKEYPQSECDGCRNRVAKHYRKTMTGDARLRRQEYERIYKEGMRRRNGVPARKWKRKRQPIHPQPKLPRFQAEEVWSYLKRFYVEYDKDDPDQLEPSRLNGVILLGQDARLIYAIKNGERKTVNFQTVDRLAIWYDLPLWEIEATAQVLEETE